MSETIDPGRLQQELKRVANTTWLSYEDRTMLLESAKAMEALRRLQQELVEKQRARIGDSEIIGRWMCQCEKAEQERDALRVERDKWQDDIRAAVALLDEHDAMRQERDALREALRESPHDMQCHPSEGRHSERCQRVKALLALTRPTDSTEAGA